MKIYKSLLIGTLLCLPALQACEQELMSYQGKPGIYFAVQHGNAAGNENTWPYQPNTYLEFFKILGQEATLNLKVMATGSVSPIDRPFTVAFNADSTSGTEGTHYAPLAGTYVIPAGEAYTYVPVTVKRTADMQDRDITIGLKLLPNEHFDLAFTQWDAIEGLWDGNVVEHFDASLHTIVVNDIMAKPSRWVGAQNNDQSESGMFGLFSRKKLELFCELFDLTYDDFTQEATMPSVFRKQIAITTSKYLAAKLAEGNPVLEDDGRLMWVNGCSWKSYPGQPYVQ